MSRSQQALRGSTSISSPLITTGTSPELENYIYPLLFPCTPLPLSSPSVPPLPPFDRVRVRLCYVSMLGTCVCASADLMQRGALECVKIEVKSSHNAKRRTAPSEAKETQWGEHELASFPEKLGPSGLCYLLRPPRTEPLHAQQRTLD